MKEYPTKTSTFGVSCARAVAPNNERTTNRDTTSFNFIFPPMNLVFCAGRSSQARPRVSRCASGRETAIRITLFCLTLEMLTGKPKLQNFENISRVDLHSNCNRQLLRCQEVDSWRGALPTAAPRPITAQSQPPWRHANE